MEEFFKLLPVCIEFELFTHFSIPFKLFVGIVDLR